MERIHLVYCARTERDIAFKDELALLARRFPKLRVRVTLTRVEGDGWTGHRGRISGDLLARIGADLTRSPVYVCGPDEMMAATCAMLAELGVPALQIRTEVFVSPKKGVDSLDAPSSSPADTPGDAAQKKPAAGEAVVRFRLSSKSVELPAERTILEVSEDAGIDIPFECRSGICGQCKIKLVEGAVTMDVEDALGPADRRRGLVLACQARAKDDIVVDA